MLRRRVLRGIVGGVAGLLLLGVLAYLLRWPLLERTVRAEIGKLLAAELQGGLASARFSGSLLAGAEAEDVVVRGLPGAPYRELRARRVSASWGFLGSSPVEIRVEGARAEFVSDPSAPGDERKTVRDIEAFFRTFRPPGPLRVSDARLVLGDGTRIDVDAASFDGPAWTARGRIDGFGRVEIDAVRVPDGPLSLSGSASEGPLRRVSLERGTKTDGAAKAKASVRVLERDVEAEGEVRYDAAGALRSAAGTAKGAGAEGSFTVDFALGRVAVDARGAVDLRDPIEAELRWSGRAEGPLLGPLADWRSSGAELRAGRAVVLGKPLDELRVDVVAATPAEVSWKGSARRGQDRVEAEGIFRPGATPEAEGSLRAALAQVSDWVPELRAETVRVAGRFRAGAELRFDGRAEAGEGEAFGVAWKALRGAFAAGPDGVEIPDVRADGVAFAPGLAGTATVDRLDGGRWAVRAEARSAGDVASFDGVAGPGGLSGAVRARGAFGAAGVPALFAPLELRGGVELKDGVARIRAEGAAGGWTPGPLEAEIGPGRAELSEVELSHRGSGWSGRVSGSAAWTEGRADLKARVSGLRLGSRELGEAEADLVHERDGLRGTLAWAGPDGTRARAEGRWGRELDVRAEGRGELAALLGLPELRGRVEAELRVTGSADAPVVAGRVAAKEAAWPPSFPLDVSLAIRTEGRRLVARVDGGETPYGLLSGEGSWAMDEGAEGALAGSFRFESPSIQVAAPHLPEDLEPWVPQASLALSATLEGTPKAPAWSASAELRAASADLPEPLAPVRDLLLRAKATSAGPVIVETLEGTMGDGPFRARGSWDLRAEGRPLRLSIEGRDLLAVTRPLSHVRVTADADLTWSETGGAKLEGLLAVPIAILHEEPIGSGGAPADPRRALTIGGLRLRPAAGGGVLLPGIPDLGGLALDLKLLSTGEVRVENSVVGARLQLEASVSGTGAQPVAHGQVRATRGEIKLPGAIFVRIVGARATIPARPGAEPSVHFEGRVGAGEGAIDIVVDGPLAAPNLELRSDPPRPREQLLAELAFGHGTGQVAGDAALATLVLRVVDQYAAGWPSADAREGFFQRLRPTVTNDEGAQTSRPWELPQNRPARGMVVRTEYVVNPWFSVVGEADGEANVGGDIKLRLRFR